MLVRLGLDCGTQVGNLPMGEGARLLAEEGGSNSDAHQLSQCSVRPSNSDRHRPPSENILRPSFGVYFCCVALLNAYGGALESPRAYLLD